MNIRADHTDPSVNDKMTSSEIFPSSRFEQDFGLFDSVFHEVSDPIVIISTTPENTAPWIEDVNHQFEVMTDFELEDIKGKSLFDFLKIDAGTQQENIILEALNARQTAVISCKCQCDDGHFINVNLTLRPISHEPQNTRFICILREEKTTDQVKNDAAKDIKGKLLAAMNHNFRTPLNGILGFSELMMAEKLGTLSKETYQEYAKDIHGAGQDLLQLINNLLDLKEIETSEFDLIEEDVKVSDLIEECHASFIEEATASEIDLITTPMSDDLIIIGDKSRLKLVVDCLLDNALKFTARGGKVELTSEIKEDGGCIITCRDNGDGMHPQQVAKAFSHDTHLHDVYQNPTTGIGYGLAYVKKLIEKHNGHVTIISSIGEGTCVSLHLPA